MKKNWHELNHIKLEPLEENLNKSKRKAQSDIQSDFSIVILSAGKGRSEIM